MTRVVIAFGSNMGRREEHLSAALLRLKDMLSEFRSSGFYESAPMYVEDQPAFLNGVVVGKTELGPQKLLREIKQIEHDLGRKKRERNGPREIDLDLVVYGSLVLSSSELTLPHPRLAERRFVLEPMREVDGELRVPGLGTVNELAGNPLLNEQRLERIADADL